MQKRWMLARMSSAERVEDHGRHALVLEARRDGVGRSGRIDTRLYFTNRNREIAAPIRLRADRRSISNRTIMSVHSTPWNV